MQWRLFLPSLNSVSRQFEPREKKRRITNSGREVDSCGRLAISNCQVVLAWIHRWQDNVLTVFVRAPIYLQEFTFSHEYHKKRRKTKKIEPRFEIYGHSWKKDEDKESTKRRGKCSLYISKTFHLNWSNFKQVVVHLYLLSRFLPHPLVFISRGNQHCWPHWIWEIFHRS